MLNKDDVVEALLLDFLNKGYSILTKGTGRTKGADIIARDPESRRKFFVSAAGPTRQEASKYEKGSPRTESQALQCMTRSVYSALRMRREDRFGPGDQIALAFPDGPACRKYLAMQKSAFDSLGVKVFVVKKDKEVTAM
jgi:hypothetical protein